MISSLSDPEISEVLEDNAWGHLGCNDGTDTYVYPLNYFFDGKSIICHSQDGTKVRIMRKNTRVCFQVDEVVDHRNWRSVMVLGEFQELEDERERYQAIKGFLDRRMHVKITDTYLQSLKEAEAEISRQHKNSKTVIYRIVIDKKLGQYEAD